jgi:AcrR family transcriptional regulator
MFSIVNMRLVKNSGRAADRTARARIRDAAITAVAAEGPARITVRKVAAAASVSPALVIHHYGSVEALREECDHYVAAEIRRLKSEAIAEGPALDLLAAIRHGHDQPLAGYLAAVLTEDSPAVARLVDELVDDAEGYLEQGVAAGIVQPAEAPRARAAVLMLWGLGGLVLHQHLRRLLGVDPTDPGFGASDAARQYLAAVYELYGNGLLTADFAEQTRASMADQPVAAPTEEAAR